MAQASQPTASERESWMGSAWMHLCCICAEGLELEGTVRCGCFMVPMDRGADIGVGMMPRDGLADIGQTCEGTGVHTWCAQKGLGYTWYDRGTPEAQDVFFFGGGH